MYIHVELVEVRCGRVNGVSVRCLMEQGNTHPSLINLAAV